MITTRESWRCTKNYDDFLFYIYLYGILTTYLVLLSKSSKLLHRNYWSKLYTFGTIDICLEINRLCSAWRISFFNCLKIDLRIWALNIECCRITWENLKKACLFKNCFELLWTADQLLRSANYLRKWNDYP